MNGGSVITNNDVKLKNGRVFPSNVNPKFSILNPEYTFTLPEYQMVSGIFDMMSHLKECGIVTNIKDLGATEEMLPQIANSTILLSGGYKTLTAEEVLDILKTAYSAV